MDERIIQFRIGVVVVAAAALTAILVMLFGAWPTLFEPKYTLHVRFPKAPGVSVETPVRKSGILIGRVSAIQLLDNGGVLLTMRVNRDVRLYSNEVARISTGSLVTGDAVVEFVSEGRSRTTELLQDDDYLTNGIVTGDPFQVLVNLEDDMSTAFRSIERAGGEVAVLVRDLDTVVTDNEEQIQRIMQKTEVALDQFNRSMRSVELIVGDPEMRERLRQSLVDLPEVFSEARQTLVEARTTFQRFDRVGQRAEANLANLEGLTAPLGERGPDLVAGMDRTLRNVDEVLAQLTLFTTAMNNREGSLGRLAGDPEMYDRLNMAAANIEEASRRLKPIVEDVRVFTDKIATDPRQLGLKGALDQQPSGAGFKFGLRRD